MAMNLTESAKLSQNALQKGVIQTIVEDAPLIQSLPFQEVAGNAYQVVRDGDLPEAGFRNLNEGYTESTGDFETYTVALKRLGGDADLDRFLVKTQGVGVAELRAEVTRQKALAVRRAFQEAFIKGDTDANPTQFDGLDKVLSGTSQEIVVDEDGVQIAGTDEYAVWDALDTLGAAINGKPDMYLMNRQTLAKLKSAARRSGNYLEDVDTFGKAIATFDGVPLVDIGDNEAGAPILGNAETAGVNADATSIYAVRFGSDGVFGVTNGGMQAYDLGELDDKPVYRTRIEFYVALAVAGSKSAAVLRGVRA